MACKAVREVQSAKDLCALRIFRAARLLKNPIPTHRLEHSADMTMKLLKFSILVWASVHLTAAFAASPGVAVQSEVGHLLTYLEKSGCEFLRNGKWHSASDARAHLERKYDYLLNKGLVIQTEDFIRHAGSQSSISKKTYQVRCAGTDPETSANWLREELQRYRKMKGTT